MIETSEIVPVLLRVCVCVDSNTSAPIDGAEFRDGLY